MYIWCCECVCACVSFIVHASPVIAPHSFYDASQVCVCLCVCAFACINVFWRAHFPLSFLSNFSYPTPSHLTPPPSLLRPHTPNSTHRTPSHPTHLNSPFSPSMRRPKCPKLSCSSSLVCVSAGLSAASTSYVDLFYVSAFYASASHVSAFYVSVFHVSPICTVAQVLWLRWWSK
jgi:hypothetical protein